MSENAPSLLLPSSRSPAADAAVAALFAQTNRCVDVASALRAAGVSSARALHARPHTESFDREGSPLISRAQDHRWEMAVDVGGHLWDEEGPTSWGKILARVHPSEPPQESAMHWSTCFCRSPCEAMPWERPKTLDVSPVDPDAFGDMTNGRETRFQEVVRRASEQLWSSDALLQWGIGLATNLNVHRFLPTEASLATAKEWHEGVRCCARLLTLEVPGKQEKFAAFPLLYASKWFNLTSFRSGQERPPVQQEYIRLGFQRWVDQKGRPSMEPWLKEAVDTAAGLYPLECLDPKPARRRM